MLPHLITLAVIVLPPIIFGWIAIKTTLE